MRLQMIRIPRGVTLPLVWQSHDQQKKKKTTFGSVELSKRSPKPEEDEATEMNSQGHKIIHESMVGMTGSHNPEVSLTQRYVED